MVHEYDSKCMYIYNIYLQGILKVDAYILIFTSLNIFAAATVMVPFTVLMRGVHLLRLLQLLPPASIIMTNDYACI